MQRTFLMMTAVAPWNVVPQPGPSTGSGSAPSAAPASCPSLASSACYGVDGGVAECRTRGEEATVVVPGLA